MPGVGGWVNKRGVENKGSSWALEPRRTSESGSALPPSMFIYLCYVHRFMLNLYDNQSWETQAPPPSYTQATSEG